MSIPIITFDGPSGSGKGTIAIMLAKKLNYLYLDSGALYRSVALKIYNEYGDVENKGLDYEKIIESMNIEFRYDSKNDIKIFIDKKECTKQIRDENIASLASKIAKIIRVRESIEKFQKNYVNPPGLVADGRDLGSIVFKNAQIKFFLTASIEKRAERRLKQLKDSGISANLPDLKNKLLERDEMDMNRTISPLVKPTDAIEIDTTKLNIIEVFEKVSMEVNNKLNK